MSMRLHPSRITVAAVAATVGLTGLVGYSAVATTSGPAVVTEVSAPHTTEAVAAKLAGIKLAGAVGERGALSRTELKAFAQKTVKSAYLTKSGTQRHTYTGALLLDVLNGADPAFASDEHDPLRTRSS